MDIWHLVSAAVLLAPVLSIKSVRRWAVQTAGGGVLYVHSLLSRDDMLNAPEVWTRSASAVDALIEQTAASVPSVEPPGTTTHRQRRR